MFGFTSVCLLLCQYYTVLIALYHGLKSGTVMPPALSFLKIVLAIWGLLWSHMKIRIVFSISVKNSVGILIEITLNL